MPFHLLASAKDEALQSRPGTDYFERNCDPSFVPDDIANDIDYAESRRPDFQTGKDISFVFLVLRAPILPL